MAEDLIESFSGVRGIWGKGLTRELTLQYGLAFVRLLRKKLKRKPALIIGYDTRPSSKEIAQLFQKSWSFGAAPVRGGGAASNGARKIIDVGCAPLPAVELGVRAYGLDGGVMITASHCPKEFNGWKLLDRTGAIISPEFSEKMIHLRKKMGTGPGQGRDCPHLSRQQDLKKRYIGLVHKIVGKKGVELIRKSHFKIVVDPNGGAAATLIKPLLKGLNVEAVYLNMKLSEFKRKIEPDFESLNYLRPIIKKQRADFAIGFDCDADRAEIVLGEDCDYTRKHGPVVNNQYLFAILTNEVLSTLKQPQGRVIVTNDCTSYLTRQVAEQYGAKIKEVEMGEVKAVNKMLQENSPIAGEGNSGVIFPPSRCRDGILSLVMLLRHLARRKKTLPEILAEYPDSFSIRDKFIFSSEKHIQIRENIKKILQKQGIKIQERGGKTGTVKALIDNESFIFFRASKTEPGVFRVIADAPSLATAKALLGQGIEIFKDANRKSQGLNRRIKPGL